MSHSPHAPCPCGSGRRYKDCCAPLVAAAPIDPDYRRFKTLQTDADEQSVNWLRREGLVLALANDWAELTGLYDPSAIGGHPFGAPFLTWFGCLRRVDGSPVPADGSDPDTPVSRLMARAAWRLTPDLREYFDAALRAPLSFWEVLEVHPGHGMVARDLLQERELFVHEQLASLTLAKWHILLAPVISWRSIHAFAGMGTIPLPPDQRDELLRLARKVVGRPWPPSPARLREVAFDLMNIYVALVEELYSTPPPVLTNTDGHDLVLTETNYAFEKDARPQIITRLNTLADVEPAGDDPHDPLDASDARYVWLRWNRKPGKEGVKIGDNTVLAQLTVSKAKLSTQTNSHEREDVLRAKLAETLGGLISRGRSKVHDLDPAGPVQAGPKRSSSPSGRPSPLEVSAMLTPEVRAYFEEHQRRWPDGPLPALGGKTPRQAVKTAAGRAQVDALLRDFENRQNRSRETNLAAFDIAWLRGELGLPER